MTLHEPIDLTTARDLCTRLGQTLGISRGDASATIDTLAANRAKVLALDNDRFAYVVAGVPYRGGLALVQIGRDYANGGANLTLTEHNKRLAERDSLVPDGNLFYGTVDTLHTLKSDDAVAAAAFTHIGGQVRGRLIRQGTDLLYSKDGIDKAIHNPGTDKEWATSGPLVGPDGKITDVATGARNYVHALTGTSDVERVNAVLSDLTGKSVTAYRINQLPPTDLRRASWIDAIAWCNLAGSISIVSGPALEWLAQKIIVSDDGLQDK